MGGVAVGVAIEPTGGPDAATPSELQSLLWTLWIRPLIRYVLRRPANQQVTRERREGASTEPAASEPGVHAESETRHLLVPDGGFADRGERFGEG